MEDWLHLHRRLSDVTLAPYFGQYFKLLRGMYTRGTRWFNRVYESRYFTAELAIKENHLHVGLDARDIAYFEFFTTGKPIVAGKFACIGVTATIKQQTVTLTPELRTGARSAHGQTISLVARPFQLQLIDEPVSEVPPATTVMRRPKYFNTLYESWAPGHSHTGVHLTSYNHGKFTTNIIRSNQNADQESIGGTMAGMHGSFSAHATRDVQFDTPFQTGFKDNPVQDTVLNDESAVPPVDWPRANGVQTVVDAVWGAREFAVYIDAFSQVSVFPTSRTGAAVDENFDQNIDQTYVKTVAAGLPGWVYQMTERFRDWYTAHATTGLTDFPENDWKLNHLGTKACAVVYKRQAVTFDSAFWDTGAVGGSMTSGDFGDYYQNYTGYGHRHNATIVGAGGQRYISATGLLELGIAIALTGPNDEDFTLNVTCTTVRDPEVTDYCTLFAGYVWYDMQDGSAAAGDMCVWDIERYYRTLTEDVIDAITNQTLLLNTQDHERYWDAGIQFFDITNDASGDPSHVRLLQRWKAGQDMSNEGTFYLDSRRTLYSLKNLTRSTELKTFPAPPSGVFEPRTHPDFDITALAFPLVGPATVRPYTIKNLLVTPWSPRAQFLNVDMKTLSFVLSFKVGQVQHRTITSGSVQAPMPWFIYHPGTAVYTFNTLRESFFPDTLPQSYKDTLTTAMAQDFRATYVSGDWTLLGLGAGPPGKANNADWTDNELGVLRYYILSSLGEGHAFNDVPVLNQRPPLDTLTIPWFPADLAYWWGAVETYARAIGLTLITNPRFHWYMYADCIMSALAQSPWSTFFVHPNGTWAFFDQSQVYNPNGVHMVDDIFSSSTSLLDLAAQVDASLFEHCIYDRVHFEFTLADNAKYSVDSRFMDLYSEAAKSAVAANKVPPGEVFEPIAPIDLKATFTKLPDGTVSASGMDLNANWTGADYVFSDDSVSHGPGFAAGFGGNSGTIDLSLDYLFGGSSPQAAAQHITFSSCLLVETD